MAKATKTAKTPAKAKTAKAPAKAKKSAPPPKAAKAKSAQKTAPKANGAPAPVGPRRTLSCELDHSSDNKNVKLVWKLDDQPVRGGAYQVDRVELRERAARIRSALATLERSTAVRAKPDDYRTALQDLAQEGARFAKTVIGATGSEQTKKAAAPFADWFMKTVARAPAGAFEILVVHRNLDTDAEGRKYVAPWHLAFTPTTDDIDDLQPTPEAYGNFWCVQFRLAVVSPDHVISMKKTPKLKANETRITAVLEENERVTRGTRYSMQDVSDQAVVHTPDALLAQAQLHGLANQFNYVWLHHAGEGVFQLGGEYIDPQLIDMSQQSVDPERVVINVFDGDCIMRDRTDWIEPLLTRTRGGLIVSETDILDKSQRYFGWALLKAAIRTAGPLSEAIVIAREQHWPRGLIYGFYCNARNVYVDPYKQLRDMLGEIDRFIGVEDGGDA